MTTDAVRTRETRAGVRGLLAALTVLVLAAVPTTASAATPSASATPAPATVTVQAVPASPAVPAPSAVPAPAVVAAPSAVPAAAAPERAVVSASAVVSPPAVVPGESSGLPVRALSGLPPQATDTYRLIVAGGPFPHSRDGIVFENRERILPGEPSGYYHEYTVPTPGSDDRGARRIVTGSAEEVYYTSDHYSSFVVVDVTR